MALMLLPLLPLLLAVVGKQSVSEEGASPLPSLELRGLLCRYPRIHTKLGLGRLSDGHKIIL